MAWRQMGAISVTLFKLAQDHVVYRGFEIRVGQMRVAQRHPRIFMSQERLQAPTLNSRHGLVTRERVAHVMEAQVFESRASRSPMESHCHLVRLERKDPFIVNTCRQRRESFVRGIVQVDVARFSVLGFDQRRDAISPIDRASGQRENLVAPHSCVECDNNK